MVVYMNTLKKLGILPQKEQLGLVLNNQQVILKRCAYLKRTFLSMKIGDQGIACIFLFAAPTFSRGHDFLFARCIFEEVRELDSANFHK
jgi:hypothetical protein